MWNTVERAVLSALLMCNYAFIQRTNVYVESFVYTVHIWQNGTRCRNVVKVLWCHSHLVWLFFFCFFLFFEDSISVFTCFFLVTCSGCFFFVVCLFSVCLLVLLGMWKKRWEGRLSGRCMVCKVWTYRTLLITKQQTAQSRTKLSKC